MNVVEHTMDEIYDLHDDYGIIAWEDFYATSKRKHKFVPVGGWRDYPGYLNRGTWLYEVRRFELGDGRQVFGPIRPVDIKRYRHLYKQPVYTNSPWRNIYYALSSKIRNHLRYHVPNFFRR